MGMPAGWCGRPGRRAPAGRAGGGLVRGHGRGDCGERGWLCAAYQVRGVRFLGIDVSDTRAAAAAFERRFGIGYPSLSDPSADTELAVGRVIPPAIPDTLLLARAGDIEARVIAQVTYPGLKRLLDEALKRGTEPGPRPGLRRHLPPPSRTDRPASAAVPLAGSPGAFGRAASGFPAAPAIRVRAASQPTSARNGRAVPYPP